MRVERTKVRKTLLALVAGIGLAAVAAPSFAQSGTDYPPMMGGYGPGYGMGPGMMGGYGPGYGRGYGPGYGMGPGMMGGCGGYGYNALNLTDAQRDKIAKIQQETQRSQWEVMSKMRETMVLGWQDAQKKIDAVLTKEQREQLKRGWGAPQ